MLSFFPLDVLDEIWDVIESVLRDFLPTLPVVALLKIGVVHIMDVFETPRHELLLRYVQFGT